MKDILSIINEAMKKNDVIARECEDRIKFYLYPESGDTSKPFITLRPLNPPRPSSYGSDNILNFEFSIQIDVQAHERVKCKAIQKEVRKVMEQLRFSQTPGGLDEYFEETKRFVDARRYKGNTKLYDTDY